MLIGSMNLRNTWAAIAVFSAVAVSGATATGIVYEDVDRNGLRGANEPGVANVAVSNGVDAADIGALRQAGERDSDVARFATRWRASRRADSTRCSWADQAVAAFGRSPQDPR